MKRILQKAMEKLSNNSAVRATITETAFYTIVKVYAPFTMRVTVDEKPATRTRVYIAEGISRRAPSDAAQPKKGVEIAEGRAMKAIALMMTKRDIDHNWRYSGSLADFGHILSNESLATPPLDIDSLNYHPDLKGEDKCC